MVAQATFGPWPKGLNLTSNRDLSSKLQPQELGEALNVCITNEGYIEPRPGIRILTNSRLQNAFETYPGGRSRILGTVRDSLGQKVNIFQYAYPKINPTAMGIDLFAIAGDTIYYICSITKTVEPTKSFGSVIQIDRAAQGDDTGIVLLSETKNEHYIFKNPLVLGGSPSVNPITKIEYGEIPGCNISLIVKDRLFIFNSESSTMYISPATRHLHFESNLTEPGTNPPVAATDIGQAIPIEPAHGDVITSVEYFRNNFYIFKRRSTFMFTFQNSPADDGYLRKVDNEKGAYHTTFYRNGIYVLNEKGVFVLDGTEFIDLQPHLNLRLEQSLSERDLEYSSSMFIADFNDKIVIGLKDLSSQNNNQDDLYGYAYPYRFGLKAYDVFYCMNAKTGAWSQWDFSYEEDATIAYMSPPGGRFFESGCLEDGRFTTYFNFVCFNGKDIGSFDGNHRSDNSYLDYTHPSIKKVYIPPVRFKLRGFTGSTFTRFVKIYRTYMRAYLSDIQSSDTLITWQFTLNYNHYYYEPNAFGKEALYNFKFQDDESSHPTFYEPGKYVDTYTDEYPRYNKLGNPTFVSVETHKLPIPQQRVTDLVLEVSRKYTGWNILGTSDPEVGPIHNYKNNRPENKGYYFSFNNFFIDFQDKVQK